MKPPLMASQPRSSASEFPSAYYTARLASDPPNTLQASALLKAGVASYEKLGSVGIEIPYPTQTILLQPPPPEERAPQP